MFDFNGQAEPSLAAFGLAAVGAETERRPDFAESQIVKVRLGDSVSLPETVQVKYNDGSIQDCPVIWNITSDEGYPVQDLSSKGVNSYKVYGKVGTLKVLAVVKVVELNYVENPSFEDADLSMWKLNNIGNVTTELFVKNMKPGKYKLSMVIHGADANNATMYLYAVSEKKKYQQPTKIDGWRNFKAPTIRDICIGSDGTIVVGASIACDKDGWGSLDDFILAPDK